MSDTEAAVSARRHPTRWILAGVGMVGLAAYFGYARFSSRGQAPGKMARGQAEARRTPVVVSPVEERNVPIVFEGLGTVTPLASVTVRSQVQGVLDSVAFSEGQMVKQGDLLAQIDPRPFQIALAQAEAARARDEAQLKNAQSNLERYQELGKQSMVSQQQVDDQAALAAQAKGVLALSQAQVRSARLQLDYARIQSPIDGMIGMRQVDPGNLIRPTDTNGLFVVTQLDPISVIFTLPQDDLATVTSAMSKRALPVEAWSRDGSLKLGEGVLTVLDNQVNSSTGTLKLKAQFSNPQRALWPNLFVKARLQVDVRQGAKVVPAVAIQRGPQGTFVYVVNEEQTAEVRKVEVDTLEGTWALIRSGLELGEKVVLEGQNQIKPGAAVDAREVEPTGPSRLEGAPVTPPSGRRGNSPSDARGEK